MMIDLVVVGDNSNCDADYKEILEGVFRESAAVHKLRTGFCSKIRLGNLEKSNLGYLYACKLLTPTSEASILRYSPFRHVAHQDLLKRKRAFPRYA